ncbi:hypothetical protein BDY17DRAFT_327394 [Neohortaea acidophila]|uniref:RhoGAP-domain-containing protein n=1 Tax=Neohortaea acidophila TaxID=245834 RepID=A0A6A6PHH6_9PEZI|nr:uncharacterized protein BDY17DRAFT_327394 [Neohortaea acidophila]KAF2479422.1 hypothetical protein BDY17DRAFT_327394 [Neohortaea acidophila]
MASVEGPMLHPESPTPMDHEDVIYPCKGCGEILEEGKAFELAGNRWHLHCFRCGSCGALLDSDANLLLLGDGSLICNNCTYSCSACGNKIEDLAILTGDQAFCSSCFRCRNCKKKIENLRYARTSQGIFCMSCHETLMARRRKKSRVPSKSAQPGAKEKALPSLPQTLPPSSAFSPDIAELETPPLTSQAATPAATSPPQRQLSAKEGLSSESLPYSDDAPTLPASTYGESRAPNTSPHVPDDGLESGFLPMTFDPTPAAGPPPSFGPPSITRKAVPSNHEPSPPAQAVNQSRDYFGKAPVRSTHREMLVDEHRPNSSRSASADRGLERSGSQARASPHIFTQDKSRAQKTSENRTPAIRSTVASPPTPTTEERAPSQLASRNNSQKEVFRLQEAPRSKKNSLRTSSDTQSPISPSKDVSIEKLASPAPSADSPSSSINPFEDPKLTENGWSGTFHRPIRGDSLAGATARKGRSPPDDAPTPTASTTHLQAGLERNASVNSAASTFTDAHESLSRDNSVTKPVESPPVMSSPDVPPPPRASSRQNRTLANGEFTTPRSAPAPPPVHNRTELAQVVEGADYDEPPGSAQYSAGLPKQSMDTPFSMEEEMARILRGEHTRGKLSTDSSHGPSMLRKVSNAVRHGRSFSDRGVSSLGRPSTRDGLEISSPMTISSPMLASPTGKDSSEQLSAQLRRAQSRITDLEAEVNRLEDTVNSSTEIKAANVELREKRTTMVVLDTQRELVVRELEVMTDHLSQAKDNSKPLDLNSLKTEVLKDFADSIQRLKDEMTAQIEDLMLKRNKLTDEIANLIQMKDKGFQEYESLTTKNAQLQEMNAQILHNIQDIYKSNRGVNGPSTANGLGIYNAGARLESPGTSEVRNLNLVNTDSSMPNLLQETEAEPATILTAPQVVNIRKGQPKKFNWRKGGEKVAKNVTKGLKAFASERGGDSQYPAIGMPYGQMSAGAAPGSDQVGSASKQYGDPGRSGSAFALWGQKSGGLKVGGLGNMKDSSSTNLVDGSVLFGSELSDRCEYEKRLIPGIVNRCIEEVEARGLDMEGIYRKSGGSGQVKLIQQGFERDGANYDIADPDLDIHAVTSALKQYFRKLPTPLITFDVYDGLLDAGRLADKEKQAAALRLVLSELPEHHRDCLEFLIQHLARVMAHEADNLMTSLNLAVVFAPTIMRPESIEREMSDMQAQRMAVQAMLEQCAVVFAEE